MKSDLRISYSAVGIYHSSRSFNYSAPRQAAHDDKDSYSQVEGIIHLEPKNNFEQALIGLDGFDHIWLIYNFHKNENWKPMTNPPRGTDQKMGVFATRSPYRPNSIGMSCVRLKKIEGLKLFVEGADLLDHTPILDIKPYIAYSDSFPKAKQGWLEGIESQRFDIQFSAQFLRQWESLCEQAKENDSTTSKSANVEQISNYEIIFQMKDFIQRQLEYEPLNDEKKRVRSLKDSTSIHASPEARPAYELAYRTWRIEFTLNPQQAIDEKMNNKKIQILELRSGYSRSDLDSTEDPYKDKFLHHWLSKQKF